jgi:hypothetical protein
LGGGASAFAEANKTVSQIDGMVRDNIGQVQAVVKQYVPLLYIVFAVPPGVMLIGFILGFLNFRRCIQMTIVWLLFLLGIILWITHALFCAGSMVFSDMCSEIRGSAYGLQNTIAALASCSNSMFQPFRTSFNTLLQDKAKEFCVMARPFCYDTAMSFAANMAADHLFVCPNPQPLDCNVQTVGSLTVWVQTALYIHNTYNSDSAAISNGLRCATVANRNRCTLDLCSTDCTNGGDLSRAGKLAKQLYSSFEALQKISVVMDTDVSDYSNCNGIFSSILGPFAEPCGTITDALIADRMASGLVGIAIIIGIFAFAMGSKRFISFSDAGKLLPEADASDKSPKEEAYSSPEPN